ncbi:uncharacterized protein LOC110691178 [Chenopodium quinoa]|uniref:uncharacterized protein LOC110691178 n=1 Tax=Chenopodium quinoa TaxID=63459 RepID=UPI000B78F7DC|nr:uncharacterized protein LOC110691178 [Chenopodium quinoa]XP_021723792.1 uncharacterized protein LOC110691178 [Chenopodium quinoa]
MSINLKNYYIHWLALHPEPSTDLQLPYDGEIPPEDPELYNELSLRWASFTDSSVSEWRKERWDRHGIKNPIYDQYFYFHNACKIHEFVDIKNKMDEIGQYLRCHCVSHAGSDWREDKASTLTSQLTTRLGFTPQLIGRLVKGRWCLYEWKFKLSSALELSSFPYKKRHIGGFSDDVIHLILDDYWNLTDAKSI